MSDSQSQHGQTIRSAVRKSARKQRLRFWHTIGVRVVFFLALLALWQLLSAAQLFDEMLFPSPAAVVAVLVDYFRDLTYVYAIAASMKRLALGYGLALVIGLPLALLVRRSPESMGTFVHLVNMPLFFTSTALVPHKQMPDWLARIAAANPLTLTVDALRSALLFGEYPRSSAGLGLSLGLAALLFWLARRELVRLALHRDRGEG